MVSESNTKRQVINPKITPCLKPFLYLSLFRAVALFRIK